MKVIITVDGEETEKSGMFKDFQKVQKGVIYKGSCPQMLVQMSGFMCIYKLKEISICFPG